MLFTESREFVGGSKRFLFGNEGFGNFVRHAVPERKHAGKHPQFGSPGADE